MIKLTLFVCLLILFIPGIAHSQDRGTINVTGSIPDFPEQILLNTKQDPKDFRKIILEWSCKSLSADRFFTIERSKNGKDFEVIGVIKGNRTQSFFEFADELPGKTNNFYRIKTIISEDQVVFSQIISKGVSIAEFCKFYPNPVEKYLIVRTESPIELKITDQLNKLRINKELEVGLHLVDLTNMERGLYIITLFQKDANRMITDKLIKN